MDMLKRLQHDIDERLREAAIQRSRGDHDGTPAEVTSPSDTAAIETDTVSERAPIAAEESKPEGEKKPSAWQTFQEKVTVAKAEANSRRQAELEQARIAGTAAGRRIAEHDLEYGRAKVKRFTLTGSEKAKDASHKAAKAAGKWFHDWEWEHEYRTAFDTAYKNVLLGKDE